MAVFAPWLTTNVSIFRNIMNNLLLETMITDSKGNFVLIQENAGKMDTTGLEFTLQVRPAKNFNLELSTTYQNSKDKRDKFENIEIGNSPKLLWYGKISYNFNPFSPAFHFQFFVNVVKMNLNRGDGDKQFFGKKVNNHFGNHKRGIKTKVNRRG